MTRRWPDLGVLVLSLLHPLVVVAPALVVAAAADRGAVPDAEGGMLLVASSVIGGAHGTATWVRLRRQPGQGLELRSAVIASVHGLVVLALMATLLLFVTLGAYPPSAVVVVDRGWPVLVPWIGAQVLAVVLSEATRSTLVTWLE